ELGRGGMGVVFKARHLVLNRLCALKVLLSNQTGSKEAHERFLNEARLSAQLHEHPHIVSVLDSGCIDDCYYMAMELIDGTTLARLINEQKVKPRAGARVVADMARALAFAHSKGIIHRDVKPQNVLVDRQSRAHLSDFGIAKMV